jgi:hypothetical protein
VIAFPPPPAAANPAADVPAILDLLADTHPRIALAMTALAKPGEVLVTRTVVDLVAGSGLRFTDHGNHVLAKGHSGWRVYAVRED